MDQALEPFRKEIVDLEDVVLRDSYTPLSLILCRIQKYICLFSVLNSIIKEVKKDYSFNVICRYDLKQYLKYLKKKFNLFQIRTQKIHGCKLLQCLHQNMYTGIPDVKSAIEK